MRKISAPFYTDDPDAQMYDSENSISLPDNNGTLEKMHGTFNPYLQTADEEGAPYDGGFSNSMFSELNLTDEDIIGLSHLTNLFFKKISSDSTVLSWGPHIPAFLKSISEEDINLISLDGSRRIVNASRFSQRYSDPMFYLSNKKVDGFFGTKPLLDVEQAKIALNNIYSNLRPIGYSIITSDSSIDIDGIIKESGFSIDKKISGNINKYLLKKNNLNKTALVKSYSKDQNNIFIFRCDVAESAQEKAAGLQPYSSLSKNCGLLFRYAAPTDLNFHMARVKFPIDIVFLDEDYQVKKSYSNIQPGSLEIFSCADAKYVLETLGGITKAAGINPGKKIFIDFYSENDEIKKESDVLNSLGISRFIVKKTALAKSSIETFDKYSVLISGSDKAPVTSLLKTASINAAASNLYLFNLNDFISSDLIPLNRIGKEDELSARISLLSGAAHTSGDFIKVSFQDFVKNNFYSKLQDKYFANISDIIYSVNKNSSELLLSLFKAASNPENKIAFVYTNDSDPRILKEAVEVSLNSRFDNNFNFSEVDCFMIPKEYGAGDIILAAEYRYGKIPTTLVSSGITKISGIPVPDSTKSVAKKSIRYINRAKKLCNKLSENLNKNLSVYEKLKDRPDAIKNSAGEYSESSKRNARLTKRILLNIKNTISLLASIQDISTTEETIGSLADTAKTFSESIKTIFDLVNVIDTDDFVESISEETNRGLGAIDDIKITLDRCKNYVSRDILGIVIISE